ncbi:MAG: hypothetical protein A3F67_00410 [Verrucomicrobia bacterium RIFCSPHIGHO2_12_FULL_41_10]|nr:MAG: hypothetical protein A3F67_00410 [Verrucomicrobia bacterium RIFCSPHIGHO2_12_FULL_41_10]
MNTLTHGKANQENIEIDFVALFHQLLEHKWLIAVIIAISLMGGKYYASKQIPVYNPDVLIQVESNRGVSGLTIGLPGMGGGSGPSLGSPAAIQIALIKSRYILTPVIQSLHLNTNLSPSHPQSRWSRILSRSQPEAEMTLFTFPPEDNRPYYLVSEKGNKISLFDSNHQRILEGKIGERLANQDKSIQLQINQISARAGTKFTLMQYPINDRMVRSMARRITIDDPEKLGLLTLAYQDTNPHLAARVVNEIAKVTQHKNTEKKSLEASKILSFLSKQLPLAKQDLTRAELALNRYHTTSGKIDTKLEIKNLIQEIMVIEKQLINLRMTKHEMFYQYTKSHPSMINLKRRIAMLHEEKKELLNEVKKLPLMDQMMLNLLRDVKMKNALNTILLSKIQEMKIIQAGLLSDVRILSYAKIPDSAVPIERAKLYGGSIIIGLIASIILIFGRKFIFPRIEDPYWTETRFNIPNLAIIPYSKEQFKDFQDLKRNVKKPIMLLSQKDPRNLSIESLRSLRTSLQVNLSCANNNIISILGASPGVGKTFVSTNLAYLLATADKRILLVDADLRKGTVHKYFNLDPSPGFAELIQGSVNIEEALKLTSHHNLTILPRGNYPVDPAELLSSERCKELISLFSKQFDIILIDTAPVLLVTDAVLISATSATNYLVLGSNVHQASHLEMAIKRLSSAGVTVHGSIFNFHNATSKKSSYQYYSSHYYYEDESDHPKKKRRTLV